MTGRIKMLTISVVTLLLATLVSPSASAIGPELVSLGFNGVLPNHVSYSESGAITSDKRYIAFSSLASNLVPGFSPPLVNGNIISSVYLRDRVTGQTIPVSVDDAGNPANDGSSNGIVSRTGRYVLFNTTATNLGRDGGGTPSCHIRDIQTGVTIPITLGIADCIGMSGDENHIGVLTNISPVPYFCPHFPCRWEVSSYMYNRSEGTFTPVAADSNGEFGKIDSNGRWNNYRANRLSMSNDAKIIAFMSVDQLVPSAPIGGNNLYVRNVDTNTIQLLKGPNEAVFNFNSYARVSGDGSHVAFTSLDAISNRPHTFVRNLNTGMDTRVDVTPGGDESNGYTDQIPSISEDGRYVAFTSTATNLTQLGSSDTVQRHVFVRDMLTGITTQVDINASGEQANGTGDVVQVLNDGTVLFNSEATNLTQAGALMQQVYLGSPSSLDAPTSLNVVSPSKAPQLTWTSVNGASVYVIYRDGQSIATVESTSYTDNAATDGSHSYYITAKNAANAESDPSNTVSVLVDNMNPSITYIVSPALTPYGWSNTDVKVTFQCSDTGTGIASCSAPVTVTAKNSNQAITGTATDNLGNKTSITVPPIGIDKTAPSVSDGSMSKSLILFKSNVTISAKATDRLSGIAKGEFFIGSDPGKGNGTPMTFNNGKISATQTIGGLTFGLHKISIRSMDKAGNWSSVTTTYFLYI